MPVESRNARASAMMVGLPWRALSPAPDGALDPGDQQHMAFLYREIAAALPLSMRRVALQATITMVPVLTARLIVDQG
jgi:hypothetical protein